MRRLTGRAVDRAHAFALDIAESVDQLFAAPDKTLGKHLERPATAAAQD